MRRGMIKRRWACLPPRNDPRNQRDHGRNEPETSHKTNGCTRLVVLWTASLAAKKLKNVTRWIHAKFKAMHTSDWSCGLIPRPTVEQGCANHGVSAEPGTRFLKVPQSPSNSTPSISQCKSLGLKTGSLWQALRCYESLNSQQAARETTTTCTCVRGSFVESLHKKVNNLRCVNSKHLSRKPSAALQTKHMTPLMRARLLSRSL